MLWFVVGSFLQVVLPDVYYQEQFVEFGESLVIVLSAIAPIMILGGFISVCGVLGKRESAVGRPASGRFRAPVDDSHAGSDFCFSLASRFCAGVVGMRPGVFARQMEWRRRFGGVAGAVGGLRIRAGYNAHIVALRLFRVAAGGFYAVVAEMPGRAICGPVGIIFRTSPVALLC